MRSGLPRKPRLRKEDRRSKQFALRVVPQMWAALVRISEMHDVDYSDTCRIALAKYIHDELGEGDPLPPPARAFSFAWVCTKTGAIFHAAGKEHVQSCPLCDVNKLGHCNRLTEADLGRL